MSAVFMKQYKGMCERGSTTLAGIDTAQRAKMLTAPEAAQVKEYWHTIYDIADLAVAVNADRTQTVTWSAPNTAFHRVRVVRTAGADVLEQSVLPTADPISFAAPTDAAEVAVTVTAQVVATTDNNGDEVSATATVPAAPAPTEPETPPAEPTPDPETPAEPESPAEPAPSEPETPAPSEESTAS